MEGDLHSGEFGKEVIGGFKDNSVNGSILKRRDDTLIYSQHKV